MVKLIMSVNVKSECRAYLPRFTALHEFVAHRHEIKRMISGSGKVLAPQLDSDIFKFRRN